ncbi:MAG: hypothetical protein Kow0047_16230 [Anaerolineae bacterium]
METNGVLKYVLFDLDETLYPPGSGVMDAIHRLMDQWIRQHIPIKPEAIPELRQRLYRQYGTSMSGLLAEYQIDPDDFLHFVHDFDPAEFLRPDPKLRRALIEVPLRRIIFTNGTRAHAQRVMAALGVEDLFERVIDVADVGYVSKPAWPAYQRAVELLGAQPEACVLVEDSLRNLLPARAMGMVTVLVSSEPADEVDFHIEHIHDIGRVIREAIRRDDLRGRPRS